MNEATRKGLNRSRGNEDREHIRRSQEKPFIDKATLDKIVGIGVPLLISTAIGALAAWALTSIPPLGGALLSVTPMAALLTLDEISLLVPEEHENAVALAALCATVVAVNTLGVVLFPYLGMPALSIMKTTLFTTGCVVLTFGALGGINKMQKGMK